VAARLQKAVEGVCMQDLHSGVTRANGLGLQSTVVTKANELLQTIQQVRICLRCVRGV
jgi:hypothetical protein